jgi:hypothetical protein
MPRARNAVVERKQERVAGFLGKPRGMDGRIAAIAVI